MCFITADGGLEAISGVAGISNAGKTDVLSFRLQDLGDVEICAWSESTSRSICRIILIRFTQLNFHFEKIKITLYLKSIGEYCINIISAKDHFLSISKSNKLIRM